MNEIGNRVVFDGTNSFIQNAKTGEVTKIKKIGRSYVFSMWIPKAGTTGTMGVSGLELDRGVGTPAGFTRPAQVLETIFEF